MKGYFQVYTGCGKGKTTAALGLILRAAGAGRRVFLGQFLKRGTYSEIRALAGKFPEVTVRQYGSGRFVRGEPTQQEKADARRGWGEIAQAVMSGQYDLVVVDEGNVAAALGLIDVADVLALAEARPGHVELVVTGRGADRRIRARADLVTEMVERKHYYAKGVKARRGIEF